MDDRIQAGGLSVAGSLHRFIAEEALPGSGVRARGRSGPARTRSSTTSRPATASCCAAATSCRPRSTTTTVRTRGRPTRQPYTAFLTEIGYLLDEPEDFEVSTDDVDDEVARIAGPQLVVPLLNARFATNASNARWGSLYDALYGSDVISREGDLAPGDSYNRVRGDEVISRGRAFLDEHFPLAGGSHADATSYAVDGEGLAVTRQGRRGAAGRPGPARRVTAATRPRPRRSCWCTTGCTSRSRSTARTRSARPTPPASRTSCSSRRSPRSWTSRTRWPPSTPTTRSLGYRNWLHLMDGTLAEEVTKGGKTFTRAMNPDRTCTAPSGETVTLPGRALLFIRQVGHLMTTDAVLDRDGNEVPEGILDAHRHRARQPEGPARRLAGSPTRAPARCTS